MTKEILHPRSCRALIQFWFFITGVLIFFIGTSIGIEIAEKYQWLSLVSYAIMITVMLLSFSCFFLLFHTIFSHKKIPDNGN